MTLCVLAFFGSSVSAQSYETAQDAFDARAWEAAAKLARAEAVKGNANSQGLLGNFIILDKVACLKAANLLSFGIRSVWQTATAAIEGLYNGAAFVFNEEQLKEIEAKATNCLSSQYKNCD